MGDAADMMLDGILCQSCGEAMTENLEDPPGYPMSCSGCEVAEHNRRTKNRLKEAGILS